MPPLLLLKLVLGRVPLMGKRVAQKRIQPMIDVHLDYVESRARASIRGLQATDDDGRRRDDELPARSRT